MKKITTIVVSLMCIGLLAGCASVQDKVDRYKENRAKVINTASFLKAEKTCIVKCNADFSFGTKRADCKATCVGVE